jgi:hypothetical protein
VNGRLRTLFILIAITSLLPVPLKSQTQMATSGQNLGDFNIATPNPSTGAPEGGFGSINPYNLLQHCVVSKTFLL